MSSSSGLKLAETIKFVHRKLREEIKSGIDAETVWEQHCKDRNTLQEYAESMHLLATEHWEKLTATDPLTSRILWTRDSLRGYFHEGGLEKARLKNKTDHSPKDKIDFSSSRIKLLDVGSCYNPFSTFTEELDVLAVDLHPALDSVYQCDFLKVPLADKTVMTTSTGKEVESLAHNQFHCVVFSFLLEYLPTAAQRWTCCVKGEQLLMEEGLLIIITPDSKAAHANAPMMRSWRCALSSIGLERVRYEKLQHAHCMAFRKTGAGHQSTVDHNHLAQMIYIPQDFAKDSEDEEEEFHHFDRPNDDDLADAFALLPSFSDD
uniref:S-adenosylmethionine sensor upstream of mTORC1 n=1 Tax=Eubosmina coregoni TaxID=186181 RepID=A0A4Y7LRC1_9CRUS|nr:EOG090X0FUY [Eubosmina coregoni]